LVWDSGRDGELVLAELCARCAGQADELVTVFGGRGREAVRLKQHVAVSPPERTPVRRVGGVVVRGVVYVFGRCTGVPRDHLLTARPRSTKRLLLLSSAPLSVRELFSAV
jgi:hypothetical protein